MYADKTNVKLQVVLLDQSLKLLGKNKNNLNVDHNMLIPLKVELRQRYFVDRHLIAEELKKNLIKKTELPEKLKQLKSAKINDVCNKIQVCIKALTYCADKGILPLQGHREKFAMDPQNPYLLKLPKFNIQIDQLPNNANGVKLIDNVAKIKGITNYLVEKLPESQPGEIPNVTSIRNAFMSWKQIRISNKEYNSLNEFKLNCSGNKDENESAKRKVGLLALVGNTDLFMSYLGYIRDSQLKN